jgi:hypothetical protein
MTNVFLGMSLGQAFSREKEIFRVGLALLLEGAFKVACP